jgi:hypothetical protein
MYHTADIPNCFLTTPQPQHITDIQSHWHTKPTTHHTSGGSVILRHYTAVGCRLNWSNAPSFFWVKQSEVSNSDILCNFMNYNYKISWNFERIFCHNFFCPFASLCEKYTLACAVGSLFKLRNCNSLVFEEFCQLKHLCQLRNVL